MGTRTRKDDDLLVGGDGNDLLSGDAHEPSGRHPPLFPHPSFGEAGLPIPVGGGLRGVGGNDILDARAGDDIMIGDAGYDRRHGTWR